MNIRIPESLKGLLESAARESGRSVTGEIVARLERSFPLSINRQILELRRKEVAELHHWIELISVSLMELKDRLASESLPPEQRSSMESALRGGGEEMKKARNELDIAQQRLDQAIRDEAARMK